MSKRLVESIVKKDLVNANEHFNERINHIVEMKLVEKKKCMQAELFNYPEINRTGWPRASEVLSSATTKAKTWASNIRKKKPTPSSSSGTPRDASSIASSAAGKLPVTPAYLVGRMIGKAGKVAVGALSDIGSRLEP